MPRAYRCCHKEPSDTSYKHVRPHRENDKKFLQDQLEKVDKWILDPTLGRVPHANETAQEKGMRERGETELLLCRCNAFLRRALFEAVQSKHPDLVTESRGGQVVLLKMSQEEKDARAAQKEQERQDKFNATVGLRQVFKVR